MKGRIRFILKISYAIKLTRRPRVRFVYTLRAKVGCLASSYRPCLACSASPLPLPLPLLCSNCHQPCLSPLHTNHTKLHLMLATHRLSTFTTNDATVSGPLPLHSAPPLFSLRRYIVPTNSYKLAFFFFTYKDHHHARRR